MKIPLNIPKPHASKYVEEARKIVDGLKKDGYNTVGINAMVAALIVEVVGNDYTGITP